MITKNNFFSNNLIKSFIHDLYKNFKEIPDDIKEQYILEIKSHLYSVALEKQKKGIEMEQIPQEVLKDFSSPKKLAAEILAEDGKDFLEEEDRTNFNNFKYAVIFSLFGLSGFIAPLIKNSLDVSAMLPGILASILGISWLLFGKFQWNDRFIKFYNNILRFRNVIIGIAFGIFAIQIIIHNKIIYFSLYYLIFYFVFCIAYFQLLKYISKKKIRN